MKDENISGVDEGETVEFLPERLNRFPIVIRGMTNDEMFIVTGIGAAIGLVVGIIGGIVTGYLAMVVTLLFIVCALTIFFGSAALRRAKRGKPETWLYRNIQWGIARRFGVQILSPVNIRSGVWSARRENVQKMKVAKNNKDRSEK